MARAPDARRQQLDRPVPAKAWRGFGLALFGAALLFMLGAPLAHLQGWQPATALLCGMGITSMLVFSLAKKGHLRNLEDDAPAPTGRRRIARDAEAVSAVIGVILMVAITVILAAVVFMLVSNMSHNTQASPTLSFQVFGGTSNSISARVLSQSEPVQWDTCTPKTQTGAANPFTVNGAAVVANAKSTAGDVMQLTGLSAKSHYEFLLVCAGGTVSTFSGDTT